VRLFAGLKSQHGTCILLEVPDPVCVGGVRDALEARGIWASGARIALNHAFANLDDTVNPGDEVAVIPPVSGG
jgi:molybdopterin converting factor small subunit